MVYGGCMSLSEADPRAWKALCRCKYW